jgi:hypothetical protein
MKTRPTGGTMSVVVAVAWGRNFRDATKDEAGWGFGAAACELSALPNSPG